MSKTEKTPRVFSIDALRAIAILGVMVTHSLVLFLRNPVMNWVWNYLHFTVVAFVFCSGYVSVYKQPGNDDRLLVWYKKRFVRLYVPYICYVLSYVLLVLIFGRGHVNVQFFLGSIFLVGGIDIGWLTLLFLQLALLTPMLLWISRNRQRLLVYLGLVGLFLLVTTFVRRPIWYSRAIAWLPWSVIFLLGCVIARRENRVYVPIRSFFLVGLVSLSIWLVFTNVLLYLHAPLTFTQHKYPPDLYYFLYGIGINSLLLVILRQWKDPSKYMKAVITFISQHSYSMFFVHLFVLEVLARVTPAASVFTVMSVSIGGTMLFIWVWSVVSGRPFRYKPS